MDWGYVAGYFDGEGSVLVIPAHKTGRAIRAQLTWHNTNRESLEAIRDFIGCGRITTQDRAPHKTGYTLCVADRDSMARVAPELLSRCIIKRAKLTELLEAIKGVKARSPAWGSLAAAGAEAVAAMYHGEGLTQQQIADRFGVTQTAVKNYLRRQGIPRRSRSDANRLANTNSPAWQERNRKISEARKREWADPELRAARIAAMRAGQPKRLATRAANKQE